MTAIFLFAWFIVFGHVQDRLHADIVQERIEAKEQKELFNYMDSMSMEMYGKPVHAVLTKLGGK